MLSLFVLGISALADPQATSDNDVDSGDLTEQLTRLLEAVEAAHPEVAAEIRQEDSEDACRAWLAAPSAQPPTSCVEMAAWHGLPPENPRAILDHTRRCFPAETSTRSYAYWLSRMHEAVIAYYVAPMSRPVLAAPAPVPVARQP